MQRIAQQSVSAVTISMMTLFLFARPTFARDAAYAHIAYHPAGAGITESVVTVKAVNHERVRIYDRCAAVNGPPAGAHPLGAASNIHDYEITIADSRLLHIGRSITLWNHFTRRKITYRGVTADRLVDAGLRQWTESTDKERTAACGE